MSDMHNTPTTESGGVLKLKYIELPRRHSFRNNFDVFLTLSSFKYSLVHALFSCTLKAIIRDPCSWLAPHQNAGGQAHQSYGDELSLVRIHHSLPSSTLTALTRH